MWIFGTNEIFAYHQLVNRTLNNYVVINPMEHDFISKMAVEVRRCIQLLGTRRNISSELTSRYTGNLKKKIQMMNFWPYKPLPRTIQILQPLTMSTTSIIGVSIQGLQSISETTNSEQCNIAVTIADGSVVYGTLKGDVKLNITTNNGKASTLTLKSVIYIEGLNRRLFPVMAFCNHPNYTVSFTHEGGGLDFGDGNSVSTTYAVFRHRDHEMVHQTIQNKFGHSATTNSTDDRSPVEGESNNTTNATLQTLRIQSKTILHVPTLDETK